MIKKIKIKACFPFFALTAFFLSGELWVNYLYALLFSLLHEAGHLAAMFIFRAFPDSITFGISGIKICKRELVLTPFQECITSLCGPFINIVMMIVFSYDTASVPFMINTGLAVFNLLPLKSLDGGRFVYNFTLSLSDSEKADRILFCAETVTLVLLIFLLIISLTEGYANTTFILFVMMLSVTTLSEMLKG